MAGRAAAVKKYILDRSLERTKLKLARLEAQIPLYQEIEAIDAKLKLLEATKALYPSQNSPSQPFSGH